jgi:hypothetical protein
MKNKDFIRILKTKDPEDLVVISGYNGGFFEIIGAKSIDFYGPFTQEWYYRKYDFCDKCILPKKKAILLVK